MAQKGAAFVSYRACSLSTSQHGFLPRQSGFSNFILPEERVTRLMGKGHTVNFFLSELPPQLRKGIRLRQPSVNTYQAKVSVNVKSIIPGSN